MVQLLTYQPKLSQWCGSWGVGAQGQAATIRGSPFLRLFPHRKVIVAIETMCIDELSDMCVNLMLVIGGLTDIDSDLCKAAPFSAHHII